MSDLSIPGLDAWPTEPLGRLCDIVIGRTPSRRRPELWDGEHPWLSIADMNQWRYIRTTKERITSLGVIASRSRLVPIGTVLLSFKLSIGKVAVADIDTYTNEAIAALPILNPKKLNRDYLFWTLRSIRLDEEVDVAAKGKTLNSKKLERLQIPLPPLDEQKRIAEVLDKADALRRQRQESLQLTEKLLQSVFIDMFGDPVTNPKEWESKELSKLGTLDRGVSKHRPRNAPDLLGGKYPLIQTGEVSNAGLYIRSFKQTYSEIGLKQSKLWPKGTLCITIAANIAQTAILDFDACFPDSVVGFTPHKGVSSSIYVHFLFGFLQAILEKNAPQAAQKNINLEILRTLSVPAPPFDLQQEFERFVSKTIVVSEDQKDALTLADRAFASIQQRAFRCELDLTRLILEPSDDTPVVIAPAKAVTKPVKPKAAARLLETPPALEPSLKKLDRIVKKGDPIPWSLDYFKYRILAVQPHPFSFADLMQKSEAVFEEPPPYETIRDLIFDLLGQDGKPAFLRQRFDLNEIKEENSGSNEVASFKGRKEIVFEPVP